MGESDIHVMEGSSVSLKCVIRQSVRDPDYIFWYQNNKRVLDYGKGAKVISSERVDANTMVATLTINNAVLRDSGNYTCQPSNLDSASAYLHVLNGTSIRYQRKMNFHRIGQMWFVGLMILAFYKILPFVYKHYCFFVFTIYRYQYSRSQDTSRYRLESILKNINAVVIQLQYFIYKRRTK